MDMRFDIPCVIFSIYTIARGFDIPWVGGRNTMGMGFDIPWVGGTIYHVYDAQYAMDRGFNILWEGGQNTMSKGVKYHG